MHSWTRRDLLKATASAAVGSTLTPSLAGALGRMTNGDHAHESVGDVTTPRERLLLDREWRFHLGHASDPARDFGFGGNDAFGKVGDLFPHVSEAKFDDSTWRSVTLPHDWAVELPFVNEPHLRGHGYKPLGREHPETSIGWYRRTFDLAPTDARKRISLEFDGVFRDSIVVLNGQYLGRNLSGYAPFAYDVTDIVNVGGHNTLVVRVDATESEGWFYEGAGIYRHVWLVKTHPIHVPQWGTFVRSTVAQRDHATSAMLTIATDVVNDADSATACHVVSEIHDASGAAVARDSAAVTPIAAWTRTTVTQHVPMVNPALWSVESPHMHALVTTLVAGDGAVLDRYETPFGIRDVRFDADNGFFLNGQRVELKGTCNHQDHAGVGVALPDRLHAYRIAKLREMGSNAYRTAHNPPAPELLDACDQLGMLVLDEARMFSSQPEGLGQLDRMIRRDRNHPSIIAWSIANEEWNVQGKPVGTNMATTMRRHAHSLDPSRPVTAAMDSSYGKGISLAVDVQGINYQREDIDALHRTMPTLPIFGTETASAFSTRGIYAKDAQRGYVSAYDVNKPGYGATAEEWWNYYSVRRWLAGGFAWTGFDYRGEPSPYDWPCISSHFGIMDTCGLPKDTYYYYQSWWSDRPVLHLFPHWTWTGSEGRDVDVWVHSNLDRVELLLNGRSLGARTIESRKHVSWTVAYAPGTIEARGYRNGALVATTRHETTGAPTRVLLHADRDWISADGEDVVVVDAQLVDRHGRFVPTADSEITFDVSGGGTIIGVGNGDPSSHEADRGVKRKLFNGRCVAIIQASRTAGALHVQATSPGLAAATAMISCRPATPRPSA